MPQELSEIIAFLEETPEVVRRLSEGISADELKVRADDGSFSFVEQVCHLRDIEQEGYGARIERILREELPTLADLDGARLAAERRYNEQRFEEGLGAFSQSRRQSTSALRAATAEQLSRRGLFEGVGPVTLRGLASLMYEHDAAHRGELRALREQLVSRRAAVE